MDLCVICKTYIEDTKAASVLGEKGCQGLLQASKERGDSIDPNVGDRVHKECRQQYTNKLLIKRDKNALKAASQETSRSLRSQVSPVSFARDCFFCGQPAIYGKRKGFEYEYYPVRTKDFQAKIAEICLSRNDAWAVEVKGRLEFSQDLHASDALYHQQCNVNFRTGKDVPKAFQTLEGSISKKSRGRPVDSTRNDAFLKVASYLEENDDEQITINDLVTKMREYCGDECYIPVHLKQKILEYFGKEVLITEINGKANVVTFRSAASSVLHKFYEQPKHHDSHKEQLRIIETAATLIKNEIKSMNATKTTYPTSEEIQSLEINLSYVPEGLQLFLKKIFVEKNPERKVASIGQAIIQAARPRVLIAPLQIGIGVQMHHHFGSKFLIDSLNSHGFSSSYSEVKRFEKSAAGCLGKEVSPLLDGQFSQFVADNVDHNTRTLDGMSTFHGMGIIQAITPGDSRSYTIPRINRRAADLALQGRIKIHFYKSNVVCNFFTYHKLPELEVKDKDWKINLLWKIVWPLKTCRPGWSGMMQAVHVGEHPGKASIKFLPMIDMNPSDMSCVYSTMMYVCEEAKRQGCTPILTFDQPLWWKAIMIQSNEPEGSVLKNIILRLGTFHMQMSFLGCIGYLMGGSGLQEALEVVYGANTVTHILGGKAYSRAVRGHFLMDSALNAIIVSKAFGIDPHVSEEQNEPLAAEVFQDQTDGSDNMQIDDTPSQSFEVLSSMEIPSEEEQESHMKSDFNGFPFDSSKLVHLYDSLIGKEITVESACQEEIIDDINDKLVQVIDSLKVARTSRLWIQYMEMIDILRKSLKAERTGDWKLHLASVCEMLPYFAAAGHNLYAKSAYLYLQLMLELQTMFPDIYEKFIAGFHVIRRSNRYWAGLSSDLVIEQVLMKNVKSTGGLTRGTGMGEAQRVSWLLSMPACTKINSAMQEFAGTAYETSEQHKDVLLARVKRDEKDTRALLLFLQERDPFASDTSLRSIATGIVADSIVNADRAKEVGDMILAKMVEKNPADFTFKKKDQAVAQSTKSTVKMQGESIQVDPQLLFQRLVAAARGMFEDPSVIFQYELCSYPSAIFESSVLLRAAKKASLGEAMWNLGECGFDGTLGNVKYVLDGGSLLQRVPWPRGASFDAICKIYTDYVRKKYLDVTVVFDGYEEGPSTKDNTHIRRYGGRVGPEVRFNGEMILQSRKDQFLANGINKQRFINHLSEKLNQVGCSTVQANGDADLLIVQTAVSCTASKPTVVIGEDTELLVLLCFHGDMDGCDLYFHSEVKSTGKKQRIWDIKSTKNRLGLDTCKLLPVVHAISGCDTTSRLFGVGKSNALKRLTNDRFTRQARIFLDENATKDDVIQAGENALLVLYNGNTGEGFHEKVSSKASAVELHQLPPTSNAAKFHSLRVYVHVQNWIGNDSRHNPEDWGWTNKNGKLFPITTSLPAAPAKLLEVVKCSCKASCDTRCTCQKNNLQCSTACGECHGTSCSNAADIHIDDIVELEDV